MRTHRAIAKLSLSPGSREPPVHPALQPYPARALHPDPSRLPSSPCHADPGLCHRPSEVRLVALARRADGSPGDPCPACPRPYLFHSHVCLYRSFSRESIVQSRVIDGWLLAWSSRVCASSSRAAGTGPAAGIMASVPVPVPTFVSVVSFPAPVAPPVVVSGRHGCDHV